LPTTVAPATTAAASTTLGIGQTSIGRVVVDARGYTVYTFGHDTVGSGTSSCTGQCATEWPAVLATGTPTAAAGITGTLGTITRSGGTQVTLNGHPLYTFSGDHAAGTANGEGIGGVWHVVSLTAGAATSPTTAAVKAPAPTAAPSPAPTSGPTTPPTTARPTPTPAPTSPPTTAHMTPTTKPNPYGY
jgi:predicted lipoprotein with Yx(FWY)xxD motif